MLLENSRINFGRACASIRSRFEGIVLSGEEKLLKPQREIFELLARRHDVVPAEAVFIDDSAANCAGACAVGFDAIHYLSSAQLADELRARGFLTA